MRSLALCVCVALAPIACAQEDLDDALFGGGDTVVTEVEQDPTADPAGALLESDKVVLGGRYSLSVELRLDLGADRDEDAFSSGLVDLSSRLFLDARPSGDFRVFIKGDLGYSSVSGAAFDLREMFADLDLADTVFLRAGKQTINWGVGAFFSPANLVNLEAIDPENPDEELAGPVALKVQLPIGASNLTSYLIIEDIGRGEDIGVAARYEFLVEGFEVTTGGVYAFAGPWALMATGSGSVEGVTVFAEAVLEGNGDRVFVVRDAGAPAGLATVTTDDAFFSATAGARYRYTSEDGLYDLSFGAQYFFNGPGHHDPSVFTDDPSAIGMLIASGELGVADLRERGRHYAAASAAASDIAGSDLSPSLFWLGNLGDGSGFVTAGVRYDGAGQLKPTLSYRFGYGPEGGEYSPRGTTHGLSLGVALSGSF